MNSEQDNQQRISRWANYASKMIAQLGTVRASALFFMIALLFAIIFTYGFHMFIKGRFDASDITGVVVYTLLGAPCVLYFFSEMVKQLESSRTNLKHTLDELELLRKHDLALNRDLQDNINLLNHQIDERKKAERAKHDAIWELEQEVADRRKAEHELSKQSALMRSIIDCSPDLIYFRDEAGRLQGSNDAFSAMVGRTEQELMGLLPEDMYSAEKAKQVAEVDREVLSQNKAMRYEITLRHANGNSAIYDMHKLPFYDLQGKRLGLVGFGRDITERKKGEEAIARAAQDKTRFLSTISHELRTPLNGIVGLIRMLRESTLTEEQRSWVNTVYSSGLTLGNIFNDLVDLDKLDRNTIDIIKEPVPLRAFVTEMSEFGQMLSRDKSLRFVTENVISEGIVASLDGTRVRQIIWNLLSNATKFTDEGFVSFSASIISAEGQDAIQFLISDTGPGIPTNQLGRIFDMYYQVQKDGVKNVAGSGIGLSVTKQLIDAMGACITVDSELGKGSSFSITIPLVEAEREEAPKFDMKLDILLVEDIPLNVKVATALLEERGHKVTAAMTGTDAINLVNDRKFDVVLLDMKLPDLTGIEVAHHIREEGENIATPIIAVTANAKLAGEYHKAGICSVLEKPLNSRLLDAIFAQLFDQSVKISHVEPEPPIEADSEVLDLETLNDYLNSLGTDLFGQSVEIFATACMNYVREAETAFADDNLQLAQDAAHKIKSAAASVVLKRIAQLAKACENSSSKQEFSEAFIQLKSKLDTDQDKLKKYLAEKV